MSCTTMVHILQVYKVMYVMWYVCRVNQLRVNDNKLQNMDFIAN